MKPGGDAAYCPCPSRSGAVAGGSSQGGYGGNSAPATSAPATSAPAAQQSYGGGATSAPATSVPAAQGYRRRAVARKVARQ